MKHHQPDNTGHVGTLTPEQWDALGEIWSFLLHLWYSEPSSPTRSSHSHSRRSSSFGLSSGSSASSPESAGACDPVFQGHDQQQTMSPTSPGSPGGGGGEEGGGTTGRHHHHHHHHRHPFGSSSGGAAETMKANGPQPLTIHTPASPTRLSQSFHQPSIASTSPTGPTSLMPGGAGAAAAALKRSAAKLKPWLPAKKFVFKYSPVEYQSAFWSFSQAEHPDTTVLRFLRARKWNVEKAMEMLILALEWRISMGVDEVMKEGEEGLEAKYPGFLAQLKNGKVIIRGHDRQGRPLCILDPSLHHQNAQSLQAVQKFSIYVIETARSMIQPPVETISVILDMTSFSMSNMDWPTTKFFIHASEACYPELLGVCVIHKAPWIFGAIWKVISRMLDPAIRAKVKFTHHRKELEEFVAADQLMKSKGFEGGDDRPYQYVEPVPDEDRLMVEDSEAKHRALARRREMEMTFERLTEIWQGQKQLSSSAAVIQERHQVGLKLAETWWAAEPYSRARTVYHRIGAIQPPVKS